MIAVLIASSDSAVYQFLSDVLLKVFSNNEITGWAKSGTALLQLANSKIPDIIILDDNLKDPTWAACVQKIKAEGLLCKFILLSENQSFDNVYKAMKMEIDAYLLKPLNINEFSTTFQNLVDKLLISEAGKDETHVQAIRKLFLLKILPESKMLLPLSEINSLYCTNFHSGIFRSVYIILNFYDSQFLLQTLRNNEQVIYNSFKQNFNSLCYDQIWEKQQNATGFFGFLNYNENKEEQIIEALKKIPAQLKNILSEFKKLSITVCVSLPHHNISEGDISLHEADMTCWSCKIKDTTGIVFYSVPDPISESDKNMLLEKTEKIKSSFETLKIKDFEEASRDFFSISQDLLSHPNVNSMFYDLVKYFFSTNSPLIEENLYDSQSLCKDFITTLMNCDTFFKIKNTFISKISDLISQLNKSMLSQNTRKIRAAISYVKNHFNEPLSLEIVAVQLNLSPRYFSALFKKETGQNFTDYVNQYRIQTAKSFLKNDTMRISEISTAVGYGDQYYFSKMFKKYVGVTPKEYREMVITNSHL